MSELINHQPTGKGTDLSTALDRLSKTLKDRGTVFLISDFIQVGVESPFREALMRLAASNDLVAIRLLAEATLELPDVGWLEMTDPETGNRVMIDTTVQQVRDNYKKRAIRAQDDITALLSEAGAELVNVDTASDPIALLSSFFRMRRATPR